MLGIKCYFYSGVWVDKETARMYMTVKPQCIGCITIYTLVFNGCMMQIKIYQFSD